MTCANKIIEYNKKIPCWLPKDPTSPFSLCTRCTHFRIEELLQEWIHGLFDFSIIENLQFQKECIDKHIDSLLNLMVHLCAQENACYKSLYNTFVKYTSFQEKLDLDIASHLSSVNCSFYRYHMKQKQKGSNAEKQIAELPIRCWSCLAWILRQKNCLGLYNSYIRYLLTSRLSFFNNHTISSLIDIMISLELKGKGHAARTLFERYRQHIKDDIKAKEVLHIFLSQPALIHEVFTKTSIEYYPYVWQKEKWKEGLQKEALKSVRKRNWVFKEELIMRTWAPHRLFRWCFDIEDLKEFDNPLEENFEQIG
jgi:hypothetical protein